MTWVAYGPLKGPIKVTVVSLSHQLFREPDTVQVAGGPESAPKLESCLANLVRRI